MRPSRIRAALVALALTGAAAIADPPRRVVSVNLCTDQLALMLAAPGQLVSVSRLARDPASSAMAEAAQAVAIHGSGAEEVYLLRPDLVLAGTYTNDATVKMLRRLGIAVEVFAPARSIADIPERMARMGALLGREAEAERQIAAFRKALAALDDAPPRRPRAALWYVNSFTLGAESLAGDILHHAGFANVADEAGLARGGTLPLERLILLAPDLVVRGRDYPGRARAEDNLAHPALRAFGAPISAQLTDRDWICGTPMVLDAVARLRQLRLSLETGQ
ncbi:MAG: ABC transporter substrate-binding protein [Jhaorihella sp.]